ncbi:hypothetical protein WJX77_008328 [Trebouxia sp. C0004]
MARGRAPIVPDTLPAWLLQCLKQCFGIAPAGRPPVSELLQVFRARFKQQNEPREQTAMLPSDAVGLQNAAHVSTLTEQASRRWQERHEQHHGLQDQVRASADSPTVLNATDVSAINVRTPIHQQIKPAQAGCHNAEALLMEPELPRRQKSYATEAPAVGAGQDYLSSARVIDRSAVEVQERQQQSQKQHMLGDHVKVTAGNLGESKTSSGSKPTQQGISRAPCQHINQAGTRGCSSAVLAAATAGQFSQSPDPRLLRPLTFSTPTMGSTILKLPNGNVYVGDCKNDQPQGLGKMKSICGSLYEGTWGQGRMTYPNKDVYIGAWKDNKRHGEGCMTYQDFGMYAGSWEAQKSWARHHDMLDQHVYIGSWDKDVRQDKQHGQGKLTFPDGKVKAGYWEAGEVKAATAYGNFTHRLFG